jgi:hypothetical protein
MLASRAIRSRWNKAPLKLKLPFSRSMRDWGACKLQGQGPVRLPSLEGISKPGGRGSRRAEPGRIPLETWLSRSFALPICGFEMPSRLKA